MSFYTVCKSDWKHFSERTFSRTQFLHKWSGICGCLYLWVCQPTNVRFEVVKDSPGRSRKCDAAHQEHEQHDVREGGCQIHHLLDAPPGCGHSSREGEKSRGIWRQQRQNQKETLRNLLLHTMVNNISYFLIRSLMRDADFNTWMLKLAWQWNI